MAAVSLWMSANRLATLLGVLIPLSLIVYLVFVVRRRQDTVTKPGRRNGQLLFQASRVMTNRAGEEQRRRIEAEIKRRNEAVARMEGQAAKAEAEAHRTAEGKRLRAEEQARRRTEAEARLNEEEARLQAEEEGHLRREEEALRLAEEFRLRAELEWGRRAGIEARLQYELEVQERAIIGTQLLAAEGRPQEVEVACRRRVEAEVRLIEAEARLQNKHEASASDEEEPQRLAEKNSKKG